MEVEKKCSRNLKHLVHLSRKTGLVHKTRQFHFYKNYNKRDIIKKDFNY